MKEDKNDIRDVEVDPENLSYMNDYIDDEKLLNELNINLNEMDAEIAKNRMKRKNSSIDDDEEQKAEWLQFFKSISNDFDIVNQNEDEHTLYLIMKRLVKEVEGNLTAYKRTSNKNYFKRAMNKIEVLKKVGEIIIDL